MSGFKVALVGLDGQACPPWVGERLRAAGLDFVVGECTTRDELRCAAHDADIVWLFGGSRVVTAERLADLPRCGAIIRSGSGTDNVPVDACTAHGIVVANTPDANVEPVSDHAVGLLLAVERQIAVQARAVHQGVWDRAVAWPRWHLNGQTLGLVGFGRIAQAVARKLRGFELRTLTYDPYVDPDTLARHEVRAVSLDELLERSDFLSIHCPLTPETRHLFSDAAFARMKRGAILVNTARGEIVDEAALLRALDSGRLGGAGLDVLEQEPPTPDNPLLGRDDVVITPHIAGYSDQWLELFWQLSVEAVLDLANGRWPRSYVNRGVTPRWNLR